MQDVARGIGLDGRIGRKFLHAGPGFGGSCFPKDCLALVRTAREAERRPVDRRDGAARSTTRASARMADRIIAACGGDVAGKTLAVLGPDLQAQHRRHARQPEPGDPAARCTAAGATIRAFDPEGHGRGEEAAARPRSIASDAYETMEGADALVLITEWNEFRALDLGRVKSAAAQPRW